jgi:hypothetical protein
VGVFWPEPAPSKSVRARLQSKKWTQRTPRPLNRSLWGDRVLAASRAVRSGQRDLSAVENRQSIPSACTNSAASGIGLR